MCRINTSMTRGNRILSPHTLFTSECSVCAMYLYFCVQHVGNEDTSSHSANRTSQVRYMSLRSSISFTTFHLHQNIPHPPIHLQHQLFFPHNPTPL